MLSGAEESRAILLRSRSIPNCETKFPLWERHQFFAPRTIATEGDKPENEAVPRDRKYYCVYILGSLSGTLYIGISGNLHKRVFQHKFHHFAGFTNRYDVTRLLFWESYDNVHKALARETQLKGWSRAKKIALIVRRNPHWLDLASEWSPWMKSLEGRDASTA